MLKPECITGLEDLRWESLITDPRLSEGKGMLEKALGILNQEKIVAEFPGLLMSSFEISYILMCEMNQDASPMVAVMLKDLLDKGKLSSEEIAREFNPEVAELLSGLQKIDRFDTRKTQSNIENFINLLLTSSDDIRVVLIRIAQR